MMRTVLRQCFGLRSTSIYPNDLGSNSDLKNSVGHIEFGPGMPIRFPENALPLVKTHEHPVDLNPAIYVVRDGRAASVSLWRFYGGRYSLEAIIEGQHHFGTWSDHVASWKPWERPNTLLVKYEDMTGNLPRVLGEISTFLGCAILTDQLPDRDTMAGFGGKWVRSQSDWKSEISDVLLERFNEINGEIMRKLNYLS